MMTLNHPADTRIRAASSPTAENSPNQSHCVIQWSMQLFWNIKLNTCDFKDIPVAKESISFRQGVTLVGLSVTVEDFWSKRRLQKCMSVVLLSSEQVWTGVNTTHTSPSSLSVYLLVCSDVPLRPPAAGAVVLQAFSVESLWAAKHQCWQQGDESQLYRDWWWTDDSECNDGEHSN